MWVEQLELCWNGERHAMRQCGYTVAHTVTLSPRKVKRLLTEQKHWNDPSAKIKPNKTNIHTHTHMQKYMLLKVSERGRMPYIIIKVI